MLRSLVGSEMCIRDRCMEHYRLFIMLGFFAMPVLGIYFLLHQSDKQVARAKATSRTARATGRDFDDVRARENLDQQTMRSFEGNLRRRDQVSSFTVSAHE
eukprot:TRINITY_DN3088_c0_g1_i5.p1 TRINITY_DN3088_c0_g1~~TRINITY_DN3088_c0_g1_i5.p1  ORF type:complete len:101 (-),score=25.94 TRINITY_DN3088_c0_g1_i5:377-679(-)